MRKTWFHGLALTLGVTAIPGFATAQYTIGDSGGLAASSFSAKPAPPPSSTHSAIRSYIEPPRAQSNLAAYAQNGPVGSGIPGLPGGHVHVPALENENSDLNHQNQSAPIYPQPIPQPYEQIQISPNPNIAQPMYSGLQSMLTQPGKSGAAESCYSESSVSCAPSVVSPNPWIFGASGLIFSRLGDDYLTLTTNTDDGANASTLSASNASMQANGGVQLSAGRYFCCGRYAIMGSYWGIFSNPRSATILASDQVSGSLRTNLQFRSLHADGVSTCNVVVSGQSVIDLFNGAFAHRILRDQQFHSAELNFFSFALGGGARQAYPASCGVDPCQSNCNPVACSGPTGPCAPWYGAQCSKLRLNMYGGLRWFQFQDSLEFAASRNDSSFNGGADDIFYRNGVTNDLVGFQLGSLATWCTGTRFNLFSGGNFGVYGNHIGATSYAGTATQTATIQSQNTTFNGRTFDFSSTQNDIALMGEGTFGAGLCICRGWTANASYRLVGVSGVATAIGQIPRAFTNGDAITHINNNRSLLLHGVTLGVNYNF